MVQTFTDVHVGGDRSDSSPFSTNNLKFAIHNLVIFDPGTELNQAQVNSLCNEDKVDEPDRHGNAWEIRQDPTFPNMFLYYKMNSGTLVDIKMNWNMAKKFMRKLIMIIY